MNIDATALPASLPLTDAQREGIARANEKLEWGLTIAYVFPLGPGRWNRCGSVLMQGRNGLWAKIHRNGSFLVRR